MALFPTSPIPRIPYQTADSYATISAGQFESGVTNTRSARLYPLFSAKLTYSPELWTAFEPLYELFAACKGRSGTFTFKDFNGWDRTPVGIPWPKLHAYTATAGGSMVSFDVPMFNSSSYILYDNGSVVPEEPIVDTPSAGHFALHGGAGTDGRDKVTLYSTTAGHVYEWKAVGQRAITARFVNDSLSFDSFVALLTTTGIGIEEAR